ncbi:MAG: hypothetical protein CEN90_334 [Parcubacteria group bacterium Licking1014_17]|nr:MAG: hypothetical protein CEN90_334 [Parcubacteria group bacterium Licking1014_17]
MEKSREDKVAIYLRFKDRTIKFRICPEDVRLDVTLDIEDWGWQHSGVDSPPR